MRGWFVVTEDQYAGEVTYRGRTHYPTEKVATEAGIAVIETAKSQGWVDGLGWLVKDGSLRRIFVISGRKAETEEYTVLARG